MVNYPNQTYLNGPLVDGVYGTNDKKSFLLSYVFTHRPYANPAALETALINARTEISNSANSQLYSVLQTATVATDITTAISANITIFQERM